MLISRKEAKDAGKKRFFTGISCYNGHVVERYVSNGICVECNLGYFKKFYRGNPEHFAKKAAKRNAANPEYRIRKNAEWVAANYERKMNNNRRRRASLIGAEGRHSTEEAVALLQSQKYLCANPYCDADLQWAEKHLDHIKPLSRGGSDGVENLQWLCGPCNRRKHAIEQAIWLAKEKDRATARGL